MSDWNKKRINGVTRHYRFTTDFKLVVDHREGGPTAYQVLNRRTGELVCGGKAPYGVREGKTMADNYVRYEEID